MTPSRLFTYNADSRHNSLQFEVTAADEAGNVVIDLGELGKAVLAKCDISEVMKCFQTIDTYAEAVA